MSVSAGTYTYGSGGGYATLAAAIADTAATLTGDLTFDQVGDSDDTGTVINKTISNPGFIFTLKSSTPHNGSPIQGYRSKFRSIFLKVNCLSGGSYIVDDFYGYAHNGSIQLLPGTISGAASQNISNSLFQMGGGGSSSEFAWSTPTSTAGNTWAGKLANNKFWTDGDYAFRASTSGSGSENPKYSVYAENNAFYGPNIAGFNPAVLYWQFNTSVSFPLANFVCRNCMVWNGDVSKPAMRLANSVLASGLAYNARNGGSDVLAWAVDGIATPDDVLSLSDASDDFLNDTPGGLIYLAGTVPVIPFNPYLPDYPIGTRSTYAPIPDAASGGLWMPSFVPGF